MKNVAEGGKGSDAVRKITVQVRAVDAPGATCDLGETSGPVPVNLRMVDDTGDVLVDSAKIMVCESGVSSKMTREVFFQSPLNCKDSVVPAGVNSTGVITATGSTPGTADFVVDHNGRCNR
jgi:hypothetical protein